MIKARGAGDRRNSIGDSRFEIAAAIARFAGSIVLGASILGLTPQALC
jgi:hypothetical protein